MSILYHPNSNRQVVFNFESYSGAVELYVTQPECSVNQIAQEAGANLAHIKPISPRIQTRQRGRKTVA